MYKNNDSKALSSEIFYQKLNFDALNYNYN